MKDFKKLIPIIVIVIVIIIALIIVFMPKNDKNTVDGIKIVQIEKEEALDTTQKQAIEATIEQFKRLGENVQERDLKVEIIERNGESYYLIFYTLLFFTRFM